MTVRTRSRRNALLARGWRACVAWCALIALAWPSLGPLSFVVHDFDDHFAAADHAHVHADVGHDVDVSSIPGSPSHPDDHHCAECDVLKHLARCVLSLPALAVAPPVVVRLLTQRIADSPAFAANPVHVPPARAPPAALA
jgi:hypothetical protein